MDVIIQFFIGSLKGQSLNILTLWALSQWHMFRTWGWKVQSNMSQPYSHSNNTGSGRITVCLTNPVSIIQGICLLSVVWAEPTAPNIWGVVVKSPSSFHKDERRWRQAGRQTTRILFGPISLMLSKCVAPEWWNMIFQNNTPMLKPVTKHREEWIMLDNVFASVSSTLHLGGWKQRFIDAKQQAYN